MGRKYGSLHVKNRMKVRLIGDAVGMVQQGYECNVRNTLWLRKNGSMASSSKANPSLKEGLELIAKILEWLPKLSVPFVKNHGEFISVYDEYLNFENIEDAAVELDKLLGCPVLFSSVFDDDVFLFGVVEGGKITSRYAGVGGEVYGIMPQRYNIEELLRFAGKRDTDTIDVAQVENEEFEQMLTSVLGFSLSGRGDI